MAEIKSTLQMVMERAERMASEVADTTKSDEVDRKGMRFAASFLSGQESDLSALLSEQPPEEQVAVRRGMAHTLLRNIVLPRETEVSEQSLLSLKALKELNGNERETEKICLELQQILEQYNQHKEQVKQQFDDSVRAQLKQKLLQQGQKVTDDASINPAMHPQYREEWARLISDLNTQYTQALDQRKELLKARLGG